MKQVGRALMMPMMLARAGSIIGISRIPGKSGRRGRGGKDGNGRKSLHALEFILLYIRSLLTMTK